MIPHGKLTLYLVICNVMRRTLEQSYAREIDDDECEHDVHVQTLAEIHSAMVWEKMTSSNFEAAA